MREQVIEEKQWVTKYKYNILIMEQIEIGKVFEVVTSHSECCGNRMYNYSYIKLEDGMSAEEINPQDYETIRVSICNCGNIFLRQRNRKENETI